MLLETFNALASLLVYFGFGWFLTESIRTKRAKRRTADAARRAVEEVGRKLASTPGNIFDVLRDQLEDCNNPDCPVHSKPAGGTR